jgi:hypothetical protein
MTTPRQIELQLTSLLSSSIVTTPNVNSGAVMETRRSTYLHLNRSDLNYGRVSAEYLAAHKDNRIAALTTVEFLPRMVADYFEIGIYHAFIQTRIPAALSYLEKLWRWIETNSPIPKLIYAEACNLFAYTNTLDFTYLDDTDLNNLLNVLTRWNEPDDYDKIELAFTLRYLALLHYRKAIHIDTSQEDSKKFIELAHANIAKALEILIPLEANSRPALTVAQINTGIIISADLVDAMRIQAEIYVFTNELSAARNLICKAYSIWNNLQISSQPSLIRFNLDLAQSNLLRREKNYEEAFEKLDNLVLEQTIVFRHFSFPNAAALYLMGLNYEDQNKLHQAASCYKEALHLLTTLKAKSLSDVNSAVNRVQQKLETLWINEQVRKLNSFPAFHPADFKDYADHLQEIEALLNTLLLNIVSLKTPEKNIFIKRLVELGIFYNVGQINLSKALAYFTRASELTNDKFFLAYIFANMACNSSSQLAMEISPNSNIKSGLNYCEKAAAYLALAPNASEAEKITVNKILKDTKNYLEEKRDARDFNKAFASMNFFKTLRHSSSCPAHLHSPAENKMEISASPKTSR